MEIAKLQAGMLVDRPLHIFLPTNQRFILMVNAFQPLEPRVLEKLKRFGQVFSTEPELDQRYPQLAEAARAVRALCDDTETAPFEKNRSLRAVSGWIVDCVLGSGRDDYAPLFFFNRAFGVPKPETLLHVADFSVDAYERGLRLAAVSGLLALWLGYADTGYLVQLAETVFCAEIGGVSGNVPGVAKADFRFRQASRGDELAELVELAQWIVMRAPGSPLPVSRIARKIERQFRQHFAPEKAVA
ncbi:MAG: hypothetical protein HY074_02685 [Deltaproteobacteria bacterium]|nr:hypothetical protein [Deltaproteobacteria bacterium]